MNLMSCVATYIQKKKHRRAKWFLNVKLSDPKTIWILSSEIECQQTAHNRTLSWRGSQTFLHTFLAYKVYTVLFSTSLYFLAVGSRAKTVWRLCNLTHPIHLSPSLAHNCFNKCRPSWKRVCDSQKRFLTSAMPLISVWGSLLLGLMDLFSQSFVCCPTYISMACHLSKCPNINKIVDPYKNL